MTTDMMRYAGQREPSEETEEAGDVHQKASCPCPLRAKARQLPSAKMNAGSTARVRRSSWGTGHESEPQQAHSERDLFEARSRRMSTLHRRPSSGTGQVLPSPAGGLPPALVFVLDPSGVESRGTRTANLTLSRRRVRLLNASASSEHREIFAAGFH